MRKAGLLTTLEKSEFAKAPTMSNPTAGSSWEPVGERGKGGNGRWGTGGRSEVRSRGEVLKKSGV